jgi:hypothetical protein
MNDQLDPAEVAYHRKVFKAFELTKAALDSWGAHLAQVYNLGPQDRIDENGHITRVTVKAPD